MKTTLLSEILDTLTDGVIIRDADGRPLLANRAAQRILGLDGDPRIDVDRHWSAWDVVDEDGISFPRARFPPDVLLRTGQPQAAVILGLKKPDGSRTWVSVDSRSIAEDGPVPGVVTTITDITEKRRAEEHLRRRNAYIDTILEQAPIGFAVHTIDDGIVRFATARFEQIYGVPRGAVDAFSTFFDKVWRNDPVFLDQIRRRVVEDMASGDPARMHWDNVPVRTDAGGTRYISAMNIPLRDQNLMVSTVQDVTDRVRVEESLREREALYRLLAENVTDLIWILDLETMKFQYVSPSVERILGYTTDEVMQRGWLDLVLTNDPARQAIVHLREQVPEFRRLGRLEGSDTIEATRRDGQRIFLEFSVRYVLNAETGHVEVYGVSRDVTERRRAEAERQRLWEELSHAQRMESVGRLAGGIAHDFNNILADMTVQLGLASAHHPELRDVFEELRTDADLGATLIRQLLVFSRRTPINTRPIDLNDVAGRLLNMVGRLLDESILVRFEPASRPAGVLADPGMIEQVIMNLAVNARDAMPDGGTLKIAVTTPGEFVCLSVADTGTGMDEDTLARAFEPFFTTKAADKGTGLGLSIVHGIVAQHAGRVEASSAVGTGSTFHVFLPAAPLPAKPGEARVDAAALAGTETILLVDDFARLREKLAEWLQRLGYVVLQAGSGEEALSTWEIHRSRIDLLFTDISLPGGMSGFHIAERLRESNPSLPVIFSSGYGAEILEDERLARGAVYLQKPCDLEVMVRTIRSCFDARSSAG